MNQLNMPTCGLPTSSTSRDIARLEQLAKFLERRWDIDKALKSDAPAFALAIVDALNFSAKLEKNPVTKIDIYKKKSEAVAAAIALGCEAGIGKDHDHQDVLYMYAQNIGVVSVHTTGLGSIPTIASWPHPWCGILRQRWAYAALENDGIRKLLVEYTSPGATGKNEAEFMRQAKAIVPHYPYADQDY